jgi:hypothetical protein
MNHQHAKRVHKKGAASTVATSLSSIIFSVIASSHHWLHMGILLLLGGSTNMLATITGILWIRRAMIISTFFSSIYSINRLNKHKQMPVWMKAMTALSISCFFWFYHLHTNKIWLVRIVIKMQFHKNLSTLG